ncbi:MAG TPA: fibronectin type III domain-containing protein [Thermoleophilia bacterium]|nr:fibronectin type III domain-containing protein [Thermoleophilia bacterium]
MHRLTTTASRRRSHRRVLLVLLAALLLLALAQAAPAPAASEYVGGPAVDNQGRADYPLYIANDHTVYALRFTAEAGTLRDKDDQPVTTPGAQYYVKVRISPTATPSGGASRGFTWNPVTRQWVQERAAWDEFPVVTTGAGGAITTGNTWTYFKFGDTTKPAALDPSTWYILVSLQPTGGESGKGTTQNNADPPAVEIIDMTGALRPGELTAAFRVHNGVATADAPENNKRVEATASEGTEVWAISRTQANGVAQGYGTVAAGDFQLAVPVGLPFDVKIKDAIWPVAAPSFTGSVADVDIALGADDVTPPAAPASLTATPADGAAELSWSAVADAEKYVVYQWQAATPVGGSTNYTPHHVAVAEVDGAARSCTVAGLDNGSEYFFEIRARDAATNTGPPSATVAVTPKAATQLTLAASAKVVKWGGSATLSGELTSDEPFASVPQVRLERSFNDSTWDLLTTIDPTAPYAVGTAVKPQRKTMYRLVFTGDATHLGATSNVVTVTPKVKLGKPVAPARVKQGRKFTVYGGLVPKAKVGSHTVRIKCYQKKAGVWRLKKTVTTTNRNHGKQSRYVRSFTLPLRGTWKLVAYAPKSAKHAATTSGARILKVQ